MRLKVIGMFIAIMTGFLLLPLIGIYWWVQIERNNARDLGFDQPPISIPAPKQIVKVFFGNRNLNKDMMDCGLVFPVEREIVKTPAVARAALNELLSGPTMPEGNGGYFTSINPGVKINSLTIVGGVARVDFDQRMDEAMGGSCRVAAIRGQITKTLMQFPTVQSVVISVEGNSEEALQP